MRLLVSVRSPAELEAATTGGADIIDVKEPAAGSLGRALDATIVALAALVPPDAPLSVALGDVRSEDAAGYAIATLPLGPRPGPIYVKLGFAGRHDVGQLGQLVAAAVAAAAEHPAKPLVIPVAYADDRDEAFVSFPALTRDAGAHGVLVDTRLKDGRTLLDALPLREIARWIDAAHTRSLLCGVAGGLRGDEIALVGALRPDVIGVRGAACVGGREGTVRSALVASLRSLVQRIGASPTTSGNRST